MYKVTATHIKTQKKVTFQIDGVNGKIFSSSKERLVLPIKEDIKKIGSKLFHISRSKTNEAFNYLKKTEKRLHPKKDDSEQTKNQ